MSDLRRSDLVMLDGSRAAPEMAWAMALSQDIKQEGGDGEQRLRDKCNWEHMGRCAVILEWGDPRTWKP